MSEASRARLNELRFKCLFLRRNPGVRTPNFTLLEKLPTFLFVRLSLSHIRFQVRKVPLITRSGSLNTEVDFCGPGPRYPNTISRCIARCLCLTPHPGSFSYTAPIAITMFVYLQHTTRLSYSALTSPFEVHSFFSLCLLLYPCDSVRVCNIAKTRQSTGQKGGLSFLQCTQRVYKHLLAALNW